MNLVQTPRLLLVGLLLAFGFIVGCGSAGSDHDDVSPPEACRDFADTVATTAERCGDDYSANRDVFIDNAANGDCANIDRVRNRSTLYGDCLPWWENLSCPEYDNYTASALPASCEDQLIRE